MDEDNFNDICLLDFYERKFLQPLLIGSRGLLRLADGRIRGTPYRNFTQLIKIYCPVLHNILTICKGTVSLFGKSLIELMKHKIYTGQTFNLCFYSCDEDYVRDIITYHSDGFVSYYNDSIIIVDKIRFISIHSVIYKNKEEMVRNIGNTSIKHFYNLEDDYFTTINAGMSLIMDGSGLDTITLPLQRTIVDKTKFMIFNDLGYIKPNIKGNTIIGISNDRYLMFSGIKKLYNINDDMFKLLCRYWYLAEVDDAKHRLLK